jgi:hypothetical protein
MCLKGCDILVLPCTILIGLLAVTLGLLVEADRQGVHIQVVTPWLAAPLRQHSEGLAELLRSPSDEERIHSLLVFLDVSGPMCSMVPAREIDECATWAGCMLASGMDTPDGEDPTTRAEAVHASRSSSPHWSLTSAWSVSLCGKEFTAGKNGTWSVSSGAQPAPHDPTMTPARDPSDEELRGRQDEVKAACLRTWQAYRKLAWGSDQLLPLSRLGHRYRGEGMGTFLVGAMETLWLLGEHEEFDAAVGWVAGNSTDLPGAFGQAMDIDQTSGESWPTAEIATQLVGGLLSAHQLSGYETLLVAAEAVGGRLEAAFRTNSGLPLQLCDIGRAVCHRPESYPHNPRGDATVEETWAVGLELAALAHASTRPEQWRHGLGQVVAKASHRMLNAIDER